MQAVRLPAPVIVKDRPWEEGLCFTYSNYTVLRDPGDGRRTNIVMGFAKGGRKPAVNPWAEGGAHSNAILIDPYPATPEQRYVKGMC